MNKLVKQSNFSSSPAGAPDRHANHQVHKFGGSSLANAERFQALKKLVSKKNEIIVVSAVAGTTSSLQKALDLAEKQSDYLPLLIELQKQHVKIITTILSQEKQHELINALESDFTEIKNILHAVQLTQIYSKEIQHIILGYGEIWSAKILAQYLAEDKKVLFLNAYQVLFVFEKNGTLCIDWQKSAIALNQFLSKQTYEQIVVTGFIASTIEGKRTILGRNGSDFSGAIFAKLFKSKDLTIWTDVDGIYTADPNKVRSAFVIDSLSYQEALELAYFGAKVLHPRTIEPLLDEQIPLFIKNSFNPSALGTHISQTAKPSPYSIKGLSSIDEVALINIEGSGLIGVSGIAARVFQILHEHHISVILIAQASSEHSICFAVANQVAEKALAALNENLQFMIESRQIQRIYADPACSILSAIGDQMIGSIGVSAKLCYSLAKANINILAISQGSSERNISVVIKMSDINKALQTVHAGFYLSNNTISIGIIGPGRIGQALLAQIQATSQQLKSSSQANILVRGIMNSKKMLLSHEAIDLADWQARFNQSAHPADLEEFAKHILADDIPHAVMIDCTANQEIAKHYLHFLQQGIHVITPNKHANAGDLAYYKQLKSLTQQRAHHYLYETTVCAGLPVITTLQDLIKTGDQIEKILGVVSGTLSYIFNELAKNRLFSEIVLEAKQLGYTEPDPREDLSGMDVARKLVCLAREIGFDAKLSDVKVYDLVPAELKAGSVEDFLKNLPSCDAKIAALAEKAKAANEVLCYYGTIDDRGQIEVALKSIPISHPFSRLSGTDNMLIFHTKRYHTQPLVIQGPGAGTEVTAAGIFADLLRLISYLS